MEDMHQVRDLSKQENIANISHFFAVYDGHGGKRAAAFVREHLVDNLVADLTTRDANVANNPDTYDEMDADQEFRSVCLQSWLATDGAFLQHALRNGIPDGSTAICCMIQSAPRTLRPLRLHIANVGDSRCALIRSDGSALPLSEDHKPNRPDELSRITAAGGQVIFAGCWRVQGDLAVSRAFGDCHLKRYGVSAEPEITTYSIGGKDSFLVLGSDGLWDVLDEVQCARVVLASPDDPTQAANALCELALASGSMDNITALVVDLRPANRF